MKGKKALLMLAAVFLLPLAAAKVVLTMGWYQGGVTNKGELINQPATLNWLAQQGQWRLLYLMPKDCSKPCEQALFQLQQIPIAVGADKERVTSILLVDEQNATAEAQQGLIQQRIGADQKRVISSPHGQSAIYLADPLNNVIMAYPITADESQWVVQAKGLLYDLKKLMKLSKVG